MARPPFVGGRAASPSESTELPFEPSPRGGFRSYKKWSRGAEALDSDGPKGCVVPCRSRRESHVPKHKDAVQLRPSRDRRGDPRGLAPVREEDLGVPKTVAGQRDGLRSRRRGNYCRGAR